MVRPHASESSKKLAVLFAETITTEVKHVAPASASVGRSGQYSIFEALSICFPQASRNSSRNGVSLVELNKELEKEGFVRVRFRNPRNPRRRKNKQQERTSRKWRDPENQSFYRYGNRRWRDPDNAEDLEHLRAMWPHVNQASSFTCPLPELLYVLRRAIAADLASEAVQRKLVGLEYGPVAHLAPSEAGAPASVVASGATTPSRSTPVSTRMEHEGSTDEELSDSDEEWVEKVVFPPLQHKQPLPRRTSLSPPPPWSMHPRSPLCDGAVQVTVKRESRSRAELDAMEGGRGGGESFSVLLGSEAAEQTLADLEAEDCLALGPGDGASW